MDVRRTFIICWWERLMFRMCSWVLWGPDVGPGALPHEKSRFPMVPILPMWSDPPYWGAVAGIPTLNEPDKSMHEAKDWTGGELWSMVKREGTARPGRARVAPMTSDSEVRCFVRTHRWGVSFGGIERHHRGYTSPD